MNITAKVDGAVAFGSFSGAFYGGNYTVAPNCSGMSGYHSLYLDASRSWTGETSYSGGNYAHENRPPYYALYYIMKIQK